MVINVKSNLLLLDKFEIKSGLFFKQPKISEIIETGYTDFILPIFLFFNPKRVFIGNKDLYDYFDKNNMDYFSTLSYLLDEDDKARDLIVKFLKFHFDDKISIDDGKISIKEKPLDRETYNSICDILMTCYDFEERIDDRNFANKETKEFTVKLYRSRIQQSERSKGKQDKKDNKNKKVKEESPLLNIISVVSTRRSKEEILDMTYFQLVDYFKTLMREKQYQALLSGAYSGTVDSKKIKNIWANEK